MQSNNADKDKSNLINLIKITKTPLAFYVLIALIAEAVFGSIAISSIGNIQILSVYTLLAMLGYDVFHLILHVAHHHQRWNLKRLIYNIRF